MTGLTAVPPLRDHDLPPKWDGAEVRWVDEAMPLGAVFMCGRGARRDSREDYCSECAQHRMHGTDVWFGKMRGEDEPTTWDRHPRTGAIRKHPGWETWPIRLVLYRCLGCSHDQVTDLNTGQTWDLDDSDYGDEGSHDPETAQGSLW